jgi:hypothetical protein
MKSFLPMVGALLASAIFAADAPKKSEEEKPQASDVAAVRTDAVAPGGQTFSRAASTFSPAVAPEIPVKGGTFSRPESTFSTPAGSFSRPGPTFSTPAGSFAHPGPIFSTPTGSFSRPSSTFSTPTGSFSRPASTFSNPTQATSPLPQGAFGTAVRPPSTFEGAGVASAPTGDAATTPAVVIDLPPGAVLRKTAPVEPVKK